MQDLLEKLKLDSQVASPLPGGDLLEKLKLDSQPELGLEEPEPIPEPMELPELYPKPGIIDKIRDLAMKVKPDLVQPVLAKMKEESEPREFVQREEPTIRAATEPEKEFAEKRGTIYGMATQPERAKTETIQGEGWSKDPKFNYWSEKIAHRAPMWMTAFAGAPSIIAIFELLTQAKNATHSLIEKSKYDPMASRQLSELIPEDSPKWFKTAATTGEYAADMIVAALASKRISKAVWEKNMKDLLGGVKKAGWFDEMARATGKGTADDWHVFYQDLIKQTTRPETIEAELQRLFKIRGGVPSPPARQIKGVAGREQPNIPVLAERIKPPVIPELQAAPGMITTEEGVTFRPGEAKEPDLTLARYRAAERQPIPAIETAPGTEITIDVTPKPGGGQSILIKSPERPVEPRTPVEPAPIAPPKVITQRKPPEYRQDPLLAAVAEIGGIKADQDYKHADLKKLLPLNLIKAAKGKAGQFMDEAAQEISGLHPELKIEDAESLWGALEVRRYKEKKPPTEKQRDIGAEEHYRAEARVFKENERNLAGILYEEDWINNKTSISYDDVIRPDIEEALGQSLKPGEPVVREGTKFNYTFEVDDAEKVLFIKREKFPEPEQKVLGVETPEVVKAELKPIEFKKDTRTSQKDYVLVEVDVSKFDKAFKKDEGYYIAPGEESIHGRRRGFEEFFKKGEAIIAPNVNLKTDGQTASFGDGRHRYAVLRDMGYKAIKVSVPKAQADKFREMFSPTRIKPRVPKFGEVEPTQMGLDTEESGKLEFEKKKEVVPEKGKELSPEEKKALGEKYEDLGKTAGAEKEEPLPEAEPEKIPERMKMANLSIRDPNGEIFDLGRVPVSKLKNIRAVARKYGVANRLKIGEPFTGKWKEYLSPTEHEKFVSGIIRDVKEIPAEEWKRWEMFSGYPITNEAKRALKAISEKTKGRKKKALDELKKELMKTDKGKVEWMFIETEMKLKDKRRLTFRKAYRAAKRTIIDTGGNVKTDIMKNLGDLGKEAAIRHDLMAGAGPAGNRLSKVAEKEIYKGLSKSEEELLNRAIYLRRQLAISKYREELTPEKEAGLEEELVLTGEEKKYIRHPHGLTKKEHQPYFEDEIPDNINKKADIYFKQMEGVLDEYLKEGMITKKSHENMKSKGDYSPRPFIQYLDPDPSYTKIITTPDSGIKALDEGSYEVMEYNSRLLLQSVIGRATSRIFRNRANKAAYKIAEEIPDNGIFIKAKKGKKTPGGHTSIKAMIEGKAKEIWMPDEFAKEWVTQDPLIGDVAANIIGWLSGSKILKAMATGLNPGFIVTNMPRDIGLIWIVSDEYSSFLPKYAFQIARDLRAVKKDAFLRKGEFIDYVDEGGMMSFLTLQGKPFKAANKAIEGAQEVLGYVGNTSEIWTRLALRKRGLRNRLEPYEATREARNYLDFYKHGSVVQVLDKGFPYLNAGIQATRGIFRAAKDRPLQTMWKFAQLGALAAGLYMAGRYVCKECLDAIPSRDKVNNFIIPTPFSIKDKNGNERYIYFKIAKDQGQRVVCTIFENMMAKYLGDEVDADQITSAVQDFLPIMPTNKIPPSFDAFFGYVANRDFWTNKDIWKSGKVDPVSEEYTPYTHPAVVKLGKTFHLSPERLDYALAQFFTRGNIYTSLVSGGLNLTMQGMDEKDKRRTSAEIIQSLPFARRVFRLTPPYSEKALKEQEEAKVEENTRRFKQKRELSEMSNTFYRKLYDDKTKDRDLLFKIRGFIKDQPTEDRARLALWFRNYGLIYDIPERVWWLNLSEMPPEARAHVYWNKWLESDEDEQKEMLRLTKKIPGITSERFNERLKTLRAKWRKLQ